MEPMTLEELGEPRYFDGESFVLVGLAGHYTQATTNKIPKQWERFVEMLDKVDPSPKVTYGICYRAKLMRYVCGVDIEAVLTIPEGWQPEGVPAQRYAAFSGEGGVASLRRMFPGIFKNWVPLHADEVSEGPMVEFYPEGFGAGHDRFEIWLPLNS